MFANKTIIRFSKCHTATHVLINTIVRDKRPNIILWININTTIYCSKSEIWLANMNFQILIKITRFNI